MPTILLVTPGRKIRAGAHVDVVLKSSVAPADLATVAALTPPEYDVDIWDEAIRGQITLTSDLPRRYDLIGVGGYTSDYERTVEIGRLLRRLSIPIVVGGVGVSSEPERYRDHFDVLFVGEAEYTWPRFLSDWRTGDYKSEYRQVSRVSMEDSPPPKWDKIASDIEYYAWGVVQTTRGCPFDCEFCDVITLFGRTPRHKSIEQVLREVQTLQRMGTVAIMLSDDNFYGDKSYYKPLLRELAALNRSFRRPLKFWTQITLNVSNDDEMLTLLAEANVTSLLIGVESPNLESLIETNKPQNYKLDIVAALKKIQSYGLRIEASLIVGFDHDDQTIFQRQFDFIQEACLDPVSIWTLTAIPGTKLWVRLHKENRVLKRRRLEKLAGLHVGLVCNVIPKRMTLEELLRGYRGLLERVHAWPAFEARLSGLIANMERHPPLMLQFRALSWPRTLRLLVRNQFDAKGRRDFWRQATDSQTQAVKKRLKGLVLGKSPRNRYLRSFIEDAVDAEWSLITYVLPEVFRAIDREMERLSTNGLPELESTVFSVSDSFRQPYTAVFPGVHDRVQHGLVDKGRTEGALVEVFYDFLTRWGSTFERLEEHHQVQLLEICDRIVAKENGASNQPEPLPPQPWVRADVGSTIRIPDVSLRRMAADVLRCVDDEFRRQKDATGAQVSPVVGC